MRTRFTSLVQIKKDALEKCELDFQQARQNMHNAQNALEQAYISLESNSIPKNGTIGNILANKMIVDVRRREIQEKHKWLDFTKKEIAFLQNKLQMLHMEYEKFRYLELEEIKQILKKQKFEESKEMDEIALAGYNLKER
jgi:flagellar biosynthesis chaperone FliJ